MPKTRDLPAWLKEYKKRTAFIRVIEMAFNPDIPDEAVREELKRVAYDMGDFFGKITKVREVNT